MKVSEEKLKEPVDLVVSSTEVLLSLLDSITETQSFKGKWSLMRTKLSALQTHLSELSSAAANDNPLSADLLRSLSAALSDGISLSARCHNPNPPGGKLKTQNDIDSLSAKIDSLSRDLEVLIKSGVLCENGAVSGSSYSKRETIRAETRNLITRLQIGTTESKNSVLDSLLRLLQEDDKNVLIAVAQGVVPVLVTLLDSTSSPEIKEKTVTALAKISTVDSSKHVLVAEGLSLLHNLLRVLESCSVTAKENSCIALQVLCHSKENARAIGCRGGISSLLQICQTGTPNCQAVAAAVLKSLAVFGEIKDDFIEENAIMILLHLSNSGTTSAQENAIGCLCNLVNGDDNLKIIVAREGGIESLKNFWDSSPSIQSLEAPVEMVRALASCPLIADFLVEHEFLTRIASVLNCGVLGVRIAAARAVSDLGSTARTRKELGEIGSIPALIAMLDGKAVEEKDAAAKALSNLMAYPGNHRIFKNEERGIPSVVQLLDPILHNLDKKAPISILNAVVESKTCRKTMVAAGAVAHLQKLVEMEVDGAKKLLHRLCHGKLWGIFSRP
nr:vacuolar protein 8 [Ipomoea batatas]GMD90145.1 vacuolar protein 8 [Ipomoea batatas]